MKVEVYVIRHGSTALNSQDGGVDRIRGWKNVPLSPKGRLEIAAAAQKLKNSGLQVLVHSDLDRATDTAAAIARTTGAKSYPSEGLRPWNLGQFTGKESNAIQDELRKYVCDEPDKAVPYGESFDDFRERVLAGVRAAIETAAGRKLGLVTHHRVERLLTAWQGKGEPADGSIDTGIMFRHGDAPATFKVMTIDVSRLPAADQEKQYASASTAPRAPSGTASSRASAAE
jgi:broad specificity phosphatase PhoE